MPRSGLCNANVCCRHNVLVRVWQVTAEFNQINGLDLVCRAHQLVQEGLKYMFNGATIIPILVCLERTVLACTEVHVAQAFACQACARK